MWRPNIQKTNLQKAILTNRDLVILDTETTGIGKNDFMIQFSARKLRKRGKQYIMEEELDIYIKPPILISKKIEELTGITNEFLADKPSEEEVFEQIRSFLQGAIPVAYNAPFDIRFLSGVYERNGVEYQYDYALDVLEMARDLVPKSQSASHKLCDIAALYGVDKNIPFHNAKGDILVTERLLRIFIMEYFDKDAVANRKRKLRYAKVLDVSYWAGFQGNSRIYVNTNMGSVYYDIKNKQWMDKNLKMEEYDMEDIRKQTFEFTGTSSEMELAKYR